MASSDQNLAQTLALYANLKAPTLGTDARSLLESLIVAAGDGFAAGGSRMISGSVNGKAFSYQVDPKLSARDFTDGLVAARALVLTLPPEQLDCLLSAPASSWGRVGFGGFSC